MGNSLYCNKPRTTDVASPLMVLATSQIVTPDEMLSGGPSESIQKFDQQVKMKIAVRR